jgi:hypothetical protein
LCLLSDLGCRAVAAAAVFWPSGYTSRRRGPRP